MTVELLCKKCGLRTPQDAPINPQHKDEQKVRMEMECHHCGRKAKFDTTIFWIRQSSKDNQPFNE